MAEIKRFGTVYFGDEAVPVGSFCPSEKESPQPVLKIGNSVPGKEIPWVEWQGKYIAAKNVCKHAIWGYINQSGYIYGNIVRIDGKQYICRCLVDGEDPDHPGEWDFILDELGDSDELWEWKGHYFWTMTTPKADSKAIVTRGYGSARKWRFTSRLYADVGLFFRPVLDPLVEEPSIDDDLLNEIVTVFGPSGPIVCSLKAYSDYDLTVLPFLRRSSHEPFLDPKPAAYACPGWAKPIGGQMVLNRDKIIAIQKYVS